MELNILPTKDEMAKAAAEHAGDILRDALARKDKLRFIAATGASQFEFLENLTSQQGIDWSRTEMFHLDEYVGIDDRHPASFVRYLRERIVDKVHPGEVHFLRGDTDKPEAEAERMSRIIEQAPVDVAFVGIGENGHLAFNDPPADFETKKPYIVVNLDEACRKQQAGEGWFQTPQDVPSQALSMSVHQIMQSENIICTVPDERKAQAVRDCLSGEAEVSPEHPASILKQHPRAFAYLDRGAASLLAS